MNIIMQLQNQIDELQKELLAVNAQSKKHFDNWQSAMLGLPAANRLIAENTHVKNQLKESNDASLALVAENINLKNQLSAQSAAEVARLNDSLRTLEQKFNREVASHCLTQQKLHGLGSENAQLMHDRTQAIAAYRLLNVVLAAHEAGNTRLENTLQNIAHKAIKATEHA